MTTNPINLPPFPHVVMCLPESDQAKIREWGRLAVAEATKGITVPPDDFWAGAVDELYLEHRPIADAIQRLRARVAELEKVPSDEEIGAVIESLGWQINMSPKPRTEAITLIHRLRAENAGLKAKEEQLAELQKWVEQSGKFNQEETG